MELVKLGKKGQVTIPRSVLRKAGITEEGPLLVTTTDNGGILLRPAAVYPIEMYTDERIREFEEANDVPEDLIEKAEKSITRKRRRKTEE